MGSMGRYRGWIYTYGIAYGIAYGISGSNREMNVLDILEYKRNDILFCIRLKDKMIEQLNETLDEVNDYDDYVLENKAIILWSLDKHIVQMQSERDELVVELDEVMRAMDRDSDTDSKGV